MHRECDIDVEEGRAGSSRPGGEPAAQPGLAAFVGTGPGSAELLTVRAAGLLGRADLVFAAAEVAGRLRHLLPCRCAGPRPG